MPNAVAYIFVVIAGISVALQQVINANLRAGIASSWWAGFVSYAGGTLTMLVIALAVDGGPPTLATAARTPFASWTGGVFGAIFIGTSIIMVPRLGAATVLALIVVGQMIGSIAFDHFGVLGLAQVPATPARILGAAFLIAGVVLIRR